MDSDLIRYRREIVQRWWECSEAERDSAAGFSAASARGVRDPELLYAFWRSQADGPDAQAYTDDLIARVRRHLRAGTGVFPHR